MSTQIPTEVDNTDKVIPSPSEEKIQEKDSQVSSKIEQPEAEEKDFQVSSKIEQLEAEEKDFQVSSKIEQLEAEKKEIQERCVRLYADLENTRKRLQREKENYVVFANKELLLSILPFLDDLERALGATNQDEKQLRGGVKLIHTNLLNSLEKHCQLEGIESTGEIFDPQVHEAIAVGEASETSEVRIIEEYQRGYLLKGRVLRTAKVKVSTVSQKKNTKETKKSSLHNLEE